MIYSLRASSRARLASRFILVTFLASSLATAKEYKQSWEALPQAESYEYEVTQGGEFNPKNRVKVEKTDETKMEIDLKPGVYHFRLRAIERGGRPGRWSPPLRFIIPTAPPVFVSPKANESLVLPGSQVPVNFEWTRNDELEDYLLRIDPVPADELKLDPKQKGKAPKPKTTVEPFLTKMVKGTTTTISGLKEGAWQARLWGRISGQPLSQSEALRFSVTIDENGRPRILAPQDGDKLAAYEEHPIRWIRSVPGKNSEVVITRMGSSGGVLSRERVQGRPIFISPELPSGKYQITVRDFIENSQESVDSTVTVEAREDPLGHHSQYSGLTWRLLLGFVYGWNAVQNYTLGSALRASEPFRFEGPQMRLQAQLTKQWGVEASAAMDTASKRKIIFKYPGDTSRNPDAPDQTQEDLQRSELQNTFKVGPTWRWQPWGPTKPLTFKGLVFAKELKQAFDPLGPNPPNRRTDFTKWPSYTPVHVYGLTTGAELRWGGWNTRYDLLGEITLDWPLFAAKPGAAALGSSSISKIPYFSFEAYLRRKIGKEWRLLLGGKAELWHGSMDQTGGGSVSNTWDLAQIGIRFGLEWDL